MSVGDSRAQVPSMPGSAAGVGALLRQWRTARRLSQLELALDAGVSSRHLSYVETGRSQPSREMVLRLAEALEIPLRERNALLVAAGYAARYFETGLGAPEMARMRSAIELILRHQEPYPAEPNMMRRALHPNGLRRVLVNWEETAGDLIRHLHSQIAASPTDEGAKSLLAEVLAYPGVPARWRTREIGAPTPPLLTTIFRRGDVELRFFSTFTTFGTPHDVTLEELRIECSFPADEATAGACRELFGSAA